MPYYPKYSQGYKPTAAKSADEYAQLDAEDESLARWKASLGIVPGATGADTTGPKVRAQENSPVTDYRISTIAI